jgi:hypothetical protein
VANAGFQSSERLEPFDRLEQLEPTHMTGQDGVHETVLPLMGFLDRGGDYTQVMNYPAASYGVSKQRTSDGIVAWVEVQSADTHRSE